MSKIKKTVFLILFAGFAVSVPTVFGRTGKVEVVVSFEKPLWKVTGRYEGPDDPTRSEIRFIDTYADAAALAGRVSGLKAFDAKGDLVELSQTREGVYIAAGSYSRFEYEVELATPSPLIAAPHVSWATDDLALFKLLDTLPELHPEKLRVSFELPADWSLFTQEKQVGDRVFEIYDYENAVFAAGKNIRTVSREIGGAAFSFAIAGEWQFEDASLAEMTDEILSEYRKIFGSFPAKRFQINLLPFPGEMANDRWRAQTQSGTVTIVSSPSTYRNLAAQRLHEQLRHELFHFWIPEGIELEGDYAWFYEGFARYQSLKTGVWVGRIRFEDFLNSISEAINISASDQSGLPLSELSRAIWATGPGIVAAKGMSVAFLCDLKLLAGSGGKRSSADVLGGLYEVNYRSGSADASGSVEAALLRYPELRGVLDRQINGTEPIDWSEHLRPFALAAEMRNGRIFLSVGPATKGKSKALLNKLGYNRWKKYSPGS